MRTLDGDCCEYELTHAFEIDNNQTGMRNNNIHDKRYQIQVYFHGANIHMKVNLNTIHM